MQISAVSHLFNGFVPLDTKSLFLTFTIEKENYEESIKSIKSRDFNLMSAIIHGQIRRQNNDDAPIGLFNDQFNKKYIRSKKYLDKKIISSLLAAYKYDKNSKLSILNKDTLKLICQKLLQTRDFKINLHWKLLAVESFIEFNIKNVKEKKICSWNLFPIEEICVPLIKLLNKTLSYIIKDVWLLNENVGEIYLKKAIKPKQLVLYLESDNPLIFEKCKSIIRGFIKDYII